MKLLLAMLTVALVAVITCGQGSVIVRIDDPSGSHCINASTEEISIHIRRIFLEKTAGIFTEDNRAGVLISAKLTGRSTGPNVDVQIPSITLVSIKNENAGRVSLPLEYGIASSLALNQNSVLTTDIELSMSLAKTRGKNTFGEILDLAGKVLAKLPIPNNPYTDATNKFLQFANGAINETISKQMDVPFAQMSLAFSKQTEPDINKCRNAGQERTGAIAVLLSRGAEGGELIPVVDTERLYCFKYSSASTYELLAAKKIGGRCPIEESAYSSVQNNYVMLLISAHRSGSGFIAQTEQEQQMEESRRRCIAFGLPLRACGILR